MRRFVTLLALFGALCSLASAQEMTIRTSSHEQYQELTGATTLCRKWNDSSTTYWNLGISNFALFGRTYDLSAMMPALLMPTQGVVGAFEFRDSTMFDVIGCMTRLVPHGTSAIIRFKVEGMAPQRILKIEWKDAGFADGASEDYTNFQLWLYETVSRCEVRFGRSSVIGPKAYAEAKGPTIGLEFASFHYDGNLQLTSSWYLAGSPAGPTVSHELAALNGVPEEGTVYTIEPTSISGVERSGSATSFLSITPSPAAHTLSLAVPTHSGSHVTARLIDMTGREAKLLFDAVSTGENLRIDASVEDVPAGVYMVRVEENGAVRIGRVVIAR